MNPEYFNLFDGHEHGSVQMQYRPNPVFRCGNCTKYVHIIIIHDKENVAVL